MPHEGLEPESAPPIGLAHVRVTGFAVGTTARLAVPRANHVRRVDLMGGTATAYLATDAGVTTSNGFPLPSNSSITFYLAPDIELWAIAGSAFNIGLAVGS